jgi:transcriptional regulator of acetoin/glycerol metabolism
VGARARTAAARERFLADGEIGPDVRPAVARSWRRSVLAGATPDAEPAPARADRDAESALRRAAEPVVARLLGELSGSPVAVVLADREACVVARWTGDRSTSRVIDDVGGAPGHVFAEDRLGTNAVGSALEDATPTAISGAEHLAEGLQDVTCVAAPIVHPVTHRLEGVLDLTCGIGHATALMLPLASRVAAEIGEQLVAGHAERDRCLLDAYLRTERRGPRRPVVALNAELLMANPAASALLDAAQSGPLWEQVRRHLDGPPAQVELVTRDRLPMLAWLEPVSSAGEHAGAVVTFRPQDTEGAVRARRGAGGPAVGGPPGRSVAWRAANERVAAVAARGDRVLLHGAPGVGKRALAAAHAPAGGLRELDAAAWSHAGAGDWLRRLDAALDARRGMLLLSHLDQLDAAAVRRVCERLEAARSACVVATLTTGAAADPPARLLSCFAHAVAVPPLRDRREDVEDIAAQVAAGAPGGGARHLDRDALRDLRARDWPDNARQLRAVVLAACAAAPGDLVRAADLPPAPASAAGPGLSRLAALELEAICAALEACGQNKQAAAQRLGISRSTLYRKLRLLE